MDEPNIAPEPPSAEDSTSKPAPMLEKKQSSKFFSRSQKSLRKSIAKEEKKAKKEAKKEAKKADKAKVVEVEVENPEGTKANNATIASAESTSLVGENAKEKKKEKKPPLEVDVVPEVPQQKLSQYQPGRETGEDIHGILVDCIGDGCRFFLCI